MQSPDVRTQLPQQFTSFVGRAREVEEIGAALVYPHCRLLTLVGPGGIGKTRLALAVASTAVLRFPDGIYFINLQPVNEIEILFTMIADLLSVTLVGQEAPASQIGRALAGKRILLILDNFEQLRSSADRLRDMLPGSDVRLLLTSREALQLEEEWLYTVSGLDFEVDTEEAGVESAAVQLFVERARRVKPNFSLEHETDAVEEICRLVEGMPLAIELAAAWTGYLPCADIAAEIERDLSFLSSHLRNLPKRHRSIQAVFDQTWKQLTPEEKAVFSRTSVFRGGFRREAATAVTGASLALLAGLIDRSLLRWERRSNKSAALGRYQTHELLRQYAADRLERDTQDTAQTVARHGRYYCRFLIRWHDDLMEGGDQAAAMAEIDAELDNVRAAWQWAAEHGDYAELERAATVLMNFFYYSDRFRDARESFQSAIHSLELRPDCFERVRAMAVILNYLAWHLMMLGTIEASDEAARRSHQIYDQLGIPPISGIDTDPRQVLCFNARLVGRYAEAITWGEEALADGRQRGHLQKQHFTHRMLCEVYVDMGELEEAQRHAQQALVVEQHNDPWSLAYTHNLLGAVAGAKGEFETAERHYQTCRELFVQIEHRVGVADALQKLGVLALAQGHHKAALPYLDQALTIFRESRVAPGEIETQGTIARVALAQGDLDAARDHLLQASFIFDRTIQYTPQTLPFLTACVAWLHAAGEFELAVHLLASVSKHAFRSVDRTTIDRLFELCRETLGEEAYRSAARHGETTPPEIHYARLKTILNGPLPVHSSLPVTHSSVLQSPTDAAAETLVEPLTPRELEVLHLIADGLTNQQIADTLFLSIGTVKSYTSHIYGKLGVSRRTQAIAHAREIGLIA